MSWGTKTEASDSLDGEESNQANVKVLRLRILDKTILLSLTRVPSRTTRYRRPMRTTTCKTEYLVSSHEHT